MKMKQEKIEDISRQIDELKGKNNCLNDKLSRANERLETSNSFRKSESRTNP